MIFSFLWLFLGSLLPNLQAIILFGTDDPTQNTTAPTGKLALAGWQWEGSWPFALGTVIGPHHVITSTHLKIDIGEIFRFRGLSYRTIGKAHLTGTDLEVFIIDGHFPDFAPLSNTRREIGRPVMLFGRGGQKGAPFEGRGWLIGAFDNLQRWGTNTVSDIIPPERSSGGELLAMDFNPAAGRDEGFFSSGDSGAGTFLLDRDGLWKLAGVNFGVDGPFTLDTNTPPFFAAIYDARKLWIGFQGFQELIPDGPNPLVARSFATRVSSYLSWLEARRSDPRPADALVLESSSNPLVNFSEETAYAVDTAALEIRSLQSQSQRFYRIRGARHLTLVKVQDGVCLLHYN